MFVPLILNILCNSHLRPWQIKKVSKMIGGVFLADWIKQCIVRCPFGSLNLAYFRRVYVAMPLLMAPVQAAGCSSDFRNYSSRLPTVCFPAPKRLDADA
jgi:hypothetical protein